MNNYKTKYLKYKSKYIIQKKLYGGSDYKKLLDDMLIIINLFPKPPYYETEEKIKQLEFHKINDYKGIHSIINRLIVECKADTPLFSKSFITNFNEHFGIPEYNEKSFAIHIFLCWISKQLKTCDRSKLKPREVANLDFNIEIADIHIDRVKGNYIKFPETIKLYLKALEDLEKKPE